MTKTSESLRDYMADASGATAMLYIRTRARSLWRFLVEQGSQWLVGWIPGPLGLLVRAAVYRPLYSRGSGSAFIENGVELFHMDKIRMGPSVYVDRLSRVHASAAQIDIGRGTRVMRGAFLTSYASNARPGEGVVTGANCWIGDHAVLSGGQGGVFLGDNVLIAAHSVVVCGNHDFEKLDADTLDQAYTGRPIRIGHNVWIGAHVTILGGVTVGDHAVIAAGAVVNTDVEPYTVVGGVPARVLRRLEARGRTEA